MYNYIKNLVYNLGANVCGIAGIDRFQDAPKGFNPTDILSDARSVIVYGKPFPRGTFVATSNAPYTLVRNQLIQEIDQLSLKLSLKIEEKGFVSIPIPSSEPYEYWDSQKRHGRGIISLKHSAQLSGLGIIGKNTLLVNERYGNRLWLGAVITDIELESDPLSQIFCPTNCQKCLKSCPQGALNGVSIDQMKCREISAKTTEGGGWLLACNICRRACPFSSK